VEHQLHQAVLSAIQGGLINSAHDLSEGGLAVALAECCISGKIGVQVEQSELSLRKDLFLFSESQSRIIVSCTPDKLDALQLHLVEAGVPITRLGFVGGVAFVVTLDGRKVIDCSIEDLESTWKGAIPCLMK
jgi:phosphoribosylformylglycinamidine synthase